MAKKQTANPSPGSAAFWVTLGGCMAALAAVPLGIGLAETPDDALSNAWVWCGLAMATIGGLAMLRGLAVHLRHEAVFGQAAVVKTTSNHASTALDTPHVAPTVQLGTDPNMWVSQSTDPDRQTSDPFRSPEDSTNSRSLRRYLLAGIGVAALLLTAALLWAGPEDDDSNSVEDREVDEASGRSEIVARIQVGRSPYGVVATRRAVWVANNLDDTVSRIDPVTNEVVETIEVGASPVGVAVSRAAVWVANSADDTVSRIDPATNEVVETIEVGPSAGPYGIAVTSDALWVAAQEGNSVIRIDPSTNEVVATIEGFRFGVEGVAATADSVWVAGRIGGEVARIDPAANQIVESIDLGGGPFGVAISGDAVWITDQGNRTLIRVRRSPD